ncbi:MAG: hypothetical protein IPI22_04840 [Bacteroidetes bacterium]|nr:hypothetical protein [Bacteroidota bacterium]
MVSQTNPFLGFKVRAKASDRIYLIKQEIDAIENKEFLTERLSIVRDTFIFCVYTGLSHSDVEKLRRDNLVTGIDGKQWLSFKGQKPMYPAIFPYWTMRWPSLEI